VVHGELRSVEALPGRDVAGPREIAPFLREALQLYRLLSFDRKVSNLRLLFYPALAFSLAPCPWPLAGLNGLALLGLVMFQGGQNDYWDHRTSGEANRFGQWLATGRPSRLALLAALALPLALCLPVVILLWRENPRHPSLLLLLFGAFVAIAYSTPPLRLKSRPPLAIGVAPVLTTAMFLESALLAGPPRAEAWALLALLFLFQLYAEALHSVVNQSSHEEKCSRAAAWRLARAVPVVSGVVALALALGMAWFWLGVAGALVRIASLAPHSPASLQAGARGQLGLASPLLALHEFAGYAALGVLSAIV
jgi:hypothetical protein